MKVRIYGWNGSTEWPSIKAFAKETVLCTLLNRHNLEHHDGLRPSCRRCGIVRDTNQEKQ